MSSDPTSTSQQAGPAKLATEAVARRGADAAACEALVREQDKDRYLANLFAPADKRAALMALHAFAVEVSRVREAVSEPLPGEVRLQWWRDCVSGTQAEYSVGGHPVAGALEAAIRDYRLPRPALTALIDARVFDLYDDLFPTLEDLEGYVGETSSSLIRLASFILAEGSDPGAAEAAGHAGVAYAIAGLLRAFPWHAARGQIYIPREILEANGVTRQDIVLGRGGPGVMRSLAEMRAVARRHLARTRALRDTIAPGIAPAFLPVALVEPYLARMDRSDYDPYRTIIGLPVWQRQWVLWRTARKAMRRG